MAVCPIRSGARLVRSPLHAFVMLVLVGGITTFATVACADDTQRAAYRAALAHLDAGRNAEFEAARAQLDSYILAPYLDYHALARRLDRVNETDLRQFRADHGDLPVARLLYHRWLKRLGERSDWTRLARNPPDDSDPDLDAGLRCQYLRARVATGATAALAEVAPLWAVGHSQPKSCDPLFEQWISAGQLTQPIAWERLVLALEAGQTSLARYLLRFLHGENQRWGRALYEVHVEPDVVLERNRFEPDGASARIVISHGLRRFAAVSPERAERAWTAYRATYAFSAVQAQAIVGAILLAYGRQGRLELPWPADLGVAPAPGLAATLAQTAVNRQQWTAARYWIAQLAPQALTETRWRYWHARSLEDAPDADAERGAMYKTLATERDYYGFLAAARAGLPPRLNAAAGGFDPAVDQALRALPAVRRAIELHAVGDLLNARREWYRLLPALDPAQQLHAAYLAQQSGWIPQSILIANAAPLRDHVELRFPIVYPQLFAEVSSRTAVAEPFLLAVARQESLFDPAARSTADARGLMQLLPTTATWVARRNALAPPETRQLHEPAVNVDLGGRYLAQLLARYGDRRPLAAAAYNAGQGRVDQWISGRAGEPVDIWIENIPFGETRNYVKNVMAFTQVYGQLLDAPAPMLAPHEATIP